MFAGFNLFTPEGQRECAVGLDLIAFRLNIFKKYDDQKRT